MIQKIKFSKYLKNFFWLSIDFVSRLVLVTIANFYIFNSLSQSEYGSLSLLTNIIFLLNPIISFGSNITFVKRFSKIQESDSLKDEFSRGITVRIFLSFFSFIIIYLLYFFEIIKYYEFILLLIICAELLYIYRELFLSKNKNEFLAISNFFSDILLLVSIILLFHNSILTLSNLCLVYLFRSIFKLIFYSYFSFKNLEINIKITYDFAYLKNLFNESYPIIFSSTSSIFTIILSQYLIKQKIGTNELGIFSAAFYLVTLITTFFTIFSNSLLEFTFKNRKRTMMNSKIIFLVFYSTILILIFILLFGKGLLGYFLSGTFIKSIDILINFFPYILIISFKPIIDKILVFSNLEYVLANRNIINLILTSFMVILFLSFDFDYKFLPICFFISEFVILISYNFIKKTKFLFSEIIYGIFKYPFYNEK